MAITWNSKSKTITRDNMIEIRDSLSPIYDLAHCSTNYTSYNLSDFASEKETNNSGVQSSNYGYNGTYRATCYSDDSSYDSSDDGSDYSSYNGSDDKRDWSSYESSNRLGDYNGDNDYN